MEKLYEKKNPTIDDVKPHDRKFGYPLHVPKWYTKFFEALPGAITWFFLLLPFTSAFIGYPEITVWYVTFLTVYWAYRSAKFVIGIYIATVRMRKDTTTDWIKKIKEEGLEDPNLKYVFILPTVKEDVSVYEPTIKAWTESEIDSRKISLVFALEDRAKDISVPHAEELIKKYGKKFKDCHYFVHPNNIVGEIKGVKNPNINWATRCFVDWIKDRGERLEDYLLITTDLDNRPHPKYLSAVTYKYLKMGKPRRVFFSTAVHTFNNNLFEVPPLVRVFSSFLTLVIMHEWVFRKKVKETWAAYIVNLQTVEDVQFWDPQIPNDDTAFYFNALIRFNGDFSGEEVYVPTYSDGVENDTILKTHKSLYKQQLRWGWGSITFPMTFAGLYKNPNIPFKKKLDIALPMIDDRLLFRTTVYLITFAIPILTLISPGFKYSTVSYNLPRIMSTILSVVTFLNIPIYLLKRQLSPIPKSWSILRHLQDILETLLITVNLLTFAFIPYLQAWTAMMFGKIEREELYATDKVKIVKK